MPSQSRRSVVGRGGKQAGTRGGRLLAIAAAAGLMGAGMASLGGCAAAGHGGSGRGAHARVAVPKKVYFYDIRAKNDSQKELIASLAGLVNRTTDEQIMLGTNDPESGSPEFWLAQLREEYPRVQVERRWDETWYLNHFKKGLVKGYVYYDRVHDRDSINVAASLAGILDAVVVDGATLHYAEAAGLKRLADATTMSPEEVFAKYGERFNKDYYINQLPDRTPYLLDIAVQKRAFMSWESPEMDQQYETMNMDGRVLGFGHEEIEFFKKASRHGLGGAPSDWLLSGSTTAGWKVPLEKQPNHTPADIQTEDGVHYVAFVMSDGDNLQWLNRGFATEDRYFGSPHRGEFAMNWDLSPELANINPVAINYFYENAKTGENPEYFVTASGRGMVYPSMHPDPEAFARDTAEAMKLVDHTVISVLDPSYDLQSLYPLLEQEQVMGIMLKTFGGAYRELGGQIFWHKGKPIVSVKHTLWSAIQEPEEILRLLNNGPKDPKNDQGSYTIVNVHPWSNFPVGGDPMSAISWINERLNDDVRVVPLDELMIHLRQNFGMPVGGAESTAAATAAPSFTR